MTDSSWKDRIERGRDILQGRSANLSANARAAAEGAGARIGEVYGQARSQVGHGSAVARDRAARLAEAGVERAGALTADARDLSADVLRRSRDTLDKAAIASRSLIAERPLTAVVIGIGAGLVLGALANRLARSRSQAAPAELSEEDEWLQ